MNWIEKKIADNKAKEKAMMLDDYINVRIVDGCLKVVIKGITIDPSMFKLDVVEVVSKIREENQ